MVRFLAGVEDDSAAILWVAADDAPGGTTDRAGARSYHNEAAARKGSARLAHIIRRTASVTAFTLRVEHRETWNYHKYD